MSKKTNTFLLQLLLLFIGFVIFILFYDNTNFDGMQKKDDDTFAKRLINRVHYATGMFSTTGSGSYRPNNPIIKLVVSLIQIFMIIHISYNIFS